MSEFHFRSHFWPFQIDTQPFFLKFLTKWLTLAILDVRNSLSIAFLAISHFRSIYATIIFFEIFDKMAAGGHFGCPKFTFDRISGHFRAIGHFGYPKFTFYRNSGHFRWIQNFFSGGHFGCLKITLDRISGHFKLIGHFGCPKFTFDGPFQIDRQLIFFENFWLNGRRGHFGWDYNVNYRTRPRYLDE